MSEDTEDRWHCPVTVRLMRTQTGMLRSSTSCHGEKKSFRGLGPNLKGSRAIGIFGHYHISSTVDWCLTQSQHFLDIC